MERRYNEFLQRIKSFVANVAILDTANKESCEVFAISHKPFIDEVCLL